MKRSSQGSARSSKSSLESGDEQPVKGRSLFNFSKQTVEEPVSLEDEDAFRQLTQEMLSSYGEPSSPEEERVSLALFEAFQDGNEAGVYRLKGQDAQFALDRIQEVCSHCVLSQKV